MHRTEKYACFIRVGIISLPPFRLNNCIVHCFSSPNMQNYISSVIRAKLCIFKHVTVINFNPCTDRTSPEQCMNIKDSVKILTEFKIYSQILYRSEVVKYISPLLSHSRLCSLVDSSLLSVPFLFSLELRKLFSNAHCVRDYQKHCQTRSHLKNFQYRTRRDGEKNLSCDLYDI